MIDPAFLAYLIKSKSDQIKLLGMTKDIDQLQCEINQAKKLLLEVTNETVREVLDEKGSA
jgi:hypothetical protein